MGSVISRAFATEGNCIGVALTRVAIIAPYAPSIVSFRGALIRALVESGSSVWVLAPDYTDATREAVRALGAHPIDYPMHRTGTNPLADWRTFWALRRILRQIQPHVLLPYNIKPILYGLLAGGWVERRVALIEGLGYAFTQTEPSVRQRVLRYLVRQMYRIALKRAHAVLFLNPDDQREFCRLSLVSAEQAVLLGGIGVNLSEYVPAPTVLEPITFTLAAHLQREKGIVEFAQAAQRIKQRYPNTRFLLLSGLDTNPGALREHEVRLWEQAGILEWHGHVPDVRPYFAQTSVYVLPSYREGVLRSTQEAMACPVITTDACLASDCLLRGFVPIMLGNTATAQRQETPPTVIIAHHTPAASGSPIALICKPMQNRATARALAELSDYSLHSPYRGFVKFLRQGRQHTQYACPTYRRRL